MPFEVADGAIADGRRPYLIGIDGEAEAGIGRFRHEFISWGQAGRLFRILKTFGIAEVVLAGGIRHRPDLLKLKLDMGAVLSLPQALGFMLGGDNTVLSGAIRLLERRGVRVLGAHEIAPSMLAGAGAISGRKPTGRNLASVRLGFSACKALGKFDIGQASVSEGGRVVALEGVEGTDLMLARIRQMREIGRLSRQGKNGVLVKTMKPGQDMRADLPAIGPFTVDGVRRAGLRGIAVEAGHALILQRENTLRAARAADIYIYGFDATPELTDA